MPRRGAVAVIAVLKRVLPLIERRVQGIEIRGRKWMVSESDFVERRRDHVREVTDGSMAIGGRIPLEGRGELALSLSGAADASCPGQDVTKAFVEGNWRRRTGRV